jgi:hypothetical protein
MYLPVTNPLAYFAGKPLKKEKKVYNVDYSLTSATVTPWLSSSRSATKLESTICDLRWQHWAKMRAGACAIKHYGFVIYSFT